MVQSRAKTILVVEDNQAMNAAISDILELHNYNILSAGDGGEALALMQRQRPDMVLCDIMMPNMDGLTLLRHTRSDEFLRTVPFIFLTARSSTQDKRHAKSIGIDDYLVKPVDTQDLLLSVENVLRREENVLIQMDRQMDRLRTQIVSALQHEFRTPLTFILGYAELLAESPPETIDVDTLRSSTAAILEGANRLRMMIEKFLLLADMQHRRELPGPLGFVDTMALLAGAAQAHAKAAEEAGLTISLNYDTDDLEMEYPSVQADSVYVRAAIDQLVVNAIQYRRADSKSIQLTITIVDGYLGLNVIDDGCGIPATELEQLRNPFVQVDRDNRVTPGIGLGLALANQIARLHGGDIQIQSQEGQGSTFTLWLPYSPKGG